MSDYLIKCLKFNIILLCFVLMVKSSASSLQNKNKATKLRDIAIRNFFIKEHEYLQEKPLSDEMKLFIRRCKRSNIGKSKRQYGEKDHMYVVQDGDIIPLKELAKEQMSTVSYFLSDNAEDFTVIPLIVPITVKKFKMGDHGASSIEFSDNSIENNINTRGESVGFETKVDENEPPVNSEVISNGKDTISATETALNGKDSSSGIEKTPTMKESYIRATKSVEIDDEDEAVVDSEETTKNAEYLNRVIEDVQELITHEQEAHHSNEGALCNVAGDWDSDAAGMQIRIEKKDNGLVFILVEREPAMEDGFLCNGQWDISGLAPYNHSSLIALTAVSRKNKKLASFIGECRICEGCETISGSWMVGRSSKNCKDRQETHVFFSDVLRKNNVRKLHEAHLREISPAPPSSSTLPPPS